MSCKKPLSSYSVHFQHDTNAIVSSEQSYVFLGELRRVLREFREYLGPERREEMQETCHAQALSPGRAGHINLASVSCGTIR